MSECWILMFWKSWPVAALICWYLPIVFSFGNQEKSGSLMNKERESQKSITPSSPRMVAIEVHRGWGVWAWRSGGGCGCAKHCEALGWSYLPLLTKVEGGFLSGFDHLFYLKRLIRMVWWPPWPGSPFPHLICSCLLPPSSNPSHHFGWTWRGTATPSRMWMQLRWESYPAIPQLWEQIDPLGRLWVVDSGQTAPFSRPHRKCPPKIFVFDLAKGKWLKWFLIHPFHCREQIGGQPCPSSQPAHIVQADCGRPVSWSEWHIRLPQWLCQWQSANLQVENKKKVWPPFATSIMWVTA